MQNKLNNTERDHFSEVFRQKLENHEVPVDANSWDQIHARLNSGKKKIIPFWYWLSGGAAVAVLALLFILRPVTESNEPIARTIHTKNIQAPTQNASIANNRSIAAVQTTRVKMKPVLMKRQESTSVHATMRLDNPPAQMSNQELADSMNKSVKAISTNLNERNNIAQSTSTKQDTIKKSNRYVPNSLVEEPVNEPIAKNKNKNGWLLAASVGSNSNLATATGKGTGYYAASSGNDHIVNAATSYTSIMTPNDFQNITYLPPVSVGLVIRKNLTKSLGLESGLVYTYLLTNFESSGAQQNNARLHLHYLGIPLNVISRLWNNPNWEIYVSGGAMLEKGIRSVYVQNQYVYNQTITTTAATNIDGVQWSVNGSVGTTYTIGKNLGIFFEPKIAYYFKNNQPISSRTKEPVIIGLTAGLRFKFK